MSLSVDYTPMSYSSLPEEKTFGPVYFSVKEPSHKKTQTLLNQHCLTGTKINTPFLLPSEIWGCARVLSAHLGRLNEGILRSVRLEATFCAKPCDLLVGTSRVLRHWNANNLPFVTVETIVTSTGGLVICRTEDDILLLNEVKTFPFYHEREKKTSFHIRASDYQERRQVYFRHCWNTSEWTRNIHTDEFAKQCGYERALPEFITYLDWALTAVYKPWPPHGIAHANFKLALPIYFGEEFSVVVRQRDALAPAVIRFVRNDGVRLLAEVQGT